jgi:CP family cyanate transporter-like MFS transporter
MTKSSAGILMVLALFAASLNLRPAINSVAPLLETLRHDLGMTASLASMLTSIPVLCMGLFSPFAAQLGARLGIERALGYALVLIGLGTVMRLFTHSSSYLLLTAFIAGLGIATTGPLLAGFIKRHFPQQVPLMISLFSVALTLGAAFASGLTAPLHTLMSWQASLAVWAVLALLTLPFWWLVVLRKVARVSGTPTASKAAGKLPWTQSRAWLLTLSFGLMAMMFYSITAWLPPMIEDLGYSKVYAGNALTIFAFIQVPVSLLLPLILKRYPSRLLLLIVFSATELIGFAMVLLHVEPWIAAIFIGIGAGGIFPLNLLLPIDATSTPQEAAAWSSMTQSTGYVIGAAGPVLLGWFHDATGSFHSSLIGLMGINAAMIAVLLLVVPGIDRKKAVAV